MKHVTVDLCLLCGTSSSLTRTSLRNELLCNAESSSDETTLCSEGKVIAFCFNFMIKIRNT